MKKNQTATKQLNNLIELRQAVYEHGLTKYRDAQMELVDALLCNQRLASYAELSLSPNHQRGWGSAYRAIEAGRQDEQQLHSMWCRQIPDGQVQVYALDTTVWPHPRARTLEGLVYEHSRPAGLAQHVAIKGHVYSLLTWIPERGRSWAPSVANERQDASETVVTLGVQQVKSMCQQRKHCSGLDVVTADSRYGNHIFLGETKSLPCAVVVRLRSNRVLYGPPEYGGRGRPPKHGKRFAFKEPERWDAPVEDVSFEDARWKRVRLRTWSDMHAKQDAETPFHLLLAEVRLDDKKPPKPIWLAYQGVDGHSARDVWTWFDHRWSIEPSIRFRKERLHWTLPAWQASERCDRWTQLVEMAYWLLFLARHLVRDQPLPWQKSQAQPTPGRVLQSIGPLFAQFGTPTRQVKLRGKSPGWPKGRKRDPPQRFEVVKRGKNRPQTAL